MLNVALTLAMRSGARRAHPPAAATSDEGDANLPLPKRGIALLSGAFVLLQATNTATVSVMALFVTQRMGLPVLWAGVALAVSAGLEIPALLGFGRLAERFSDLALVVAGCVAGVVYYAAMAVVGGPIALVALQVLNACFFAAVAGPGMTLFLDLIPRPGAASGLYMNTRRVGAIVSGPLIGLGATTTLGYGLTFLACAGFTAVALVVVAVMWRQRASLTPSAALSVDS